MLFKIPKVVPQELQKDIKSIREEIANMFSHGLGILLGLIGAPFMLVAVWNTGNLLHFFACLIFCLAILMTYTASTLYHSSYSQKIRLMLRKMDHISIYFLIAGSYTPIILMHIQTTVGWVIFATVWAMVAVGTVFKIFFVNKFRVVSTLAYLVMGWMAIFLIKPMMANLPPISLSLIVAGGLFYTLGSVFYLWKKLSYNHFVWHLFVLAGTVCHFLAVYKGI